MSLWNCSLQLSASALLYATERCQVRQSGYYWLIVQIMQAHTKEQIALSPHTSFRGYQQLGANVTRYDGGFQRDWHEAIDLYKEEADTVGRHRSNLHSCPACCINQLLTPDIQPCPLLLQP